MGLGSLLSPKPRPAGLIKYVLLSFSFLDLLPIFPLGGPDPAPDIGGSLSEIGFCLPFTLGEGRRDTAEHNWEAEGLDGGLRFASLI